MSADTDYLETTTLRQFLDAGGELVYRPEGNTSIVEQPRAQGGLLPRRGDGGMMVPLGNGCTYRIAGVEYSAQDALAKLNAKADA